jgi:hypothetical protein
MHWRFDFRDTQLQHTIQGFAYPGHWSVRHQGCTIPEGPYGNHGTPEVNEGISFELRGPDGTPVPAWEPGANYTIIVSKFPDAQQTNAWVHASTGAYKWHFRMQFVN